MFIDNLGTINKKVLMDSIPKFEEKRLYYFRREKGNYMSFAVINGKTQELLMNGTAWEVLELCDGKKNILKIIEDYQVRYLYLNNNSDYMKDVVISLYTFDKLWLLSWGKEGTPFMINKEITLDNGYTLTWTNENDISDIAATYEKYVGYTGYFNHNYPNNRKKGLSDYQKETVLRSKLFYYNEDYFILKNTENEVVGIISVSNNQPDTDIVEITTLIVPENVIENVLKGLQQILKEYYIFDINKIRIKFISSDLSQIMKESISRCGFINSAVLKDEYGKDNDLMMFDFFYERVNAYE